MAAGKRKVEAKKRGSNIKNRGSSRKQESSSRPLTARILGFSKLDRYTRPAKIPDAAKLDSNENYVINRDLISGIVAEAIRHVDLREYPIDELDVLYDRLHAYTGIPKRYIAAGSGSDQIIELILSTIGGKRASIFTPTFSYFVNRCELHGIKVDQVPLQKNDFSLDPGQFIESAKRSDMAYICSPNNPTGNQFSRSVVLDLLDSIPKNTLILVDEAYVEFADYSLASEASQRDNLVVLRTLSKAFGLAGARLGYMITNSDFADVFRSTIQSPYPISTMSLAVASAMLNNVSVMKDSVKLIRRERSRVIERQIGRASCRERV